MVYGVLRFSEGGSDVREVNKNNNIGRCLLTSATIVGRYICGGWLNGKTHFELTPVTVWTKCMRSHIRVSFTLYAWFYLNIITRIRVVNVYVYVFHFPFFIAMYLLYGIHSTDRTNTKRATYSQGVDMGLKYCFGNEMKRKPLDRYEYDHLLNTTVRCRYLWETCL